MTSPSLSRGEILILFKSNVLGTIESDLLAYALHIRHVLLPQG